ncbi:MAG: CBS domain-containing protein [Myxococcales bacterium]|nr:CBS domain-containing protein [Myxococcales bacterium]
MATVGEIMNTGMLKVALETRAGECLDRMLDQGARHAVVVDADGGVAGLLTDAALHITNPTLSVFSALVPVPTMSDETSVEDAARLLVGTSQDAAVVVDDEGHPVGLLAEADVVRYAPVLLDTRSRVVLRAWRPPVSVHPDSTLSAAFDTMVNHQIRHLLITDNGPVLGVVSFRDLLATGVTRDADGVVQQLLGGGPVRLVHEGASLDEVVTLMRTHDIGCVPVLDSNNLPVGIVTRSDVLEQIVQG